MADRISIERGRALAHLTHAGLREAYCEVTIAGKPHILDARLVEGYSSLDHMADVPLAAIVREVSGQDYATEAAFRKAASKAQRAALKGGPRIDYTLTPGTLRERFFGEVMESLRAAVKGRDSRVTGMSLPSLYDISPQSHERIVYVRDGEVRVSVRVSHEDGYSYRQIWAAGGVSNPEELCAPNGIRWSHVKDIYPV